MVKNFAELQEWVKSSEPLVVSMAQVANREALSSVKAAADQGSTKFMLTGDQGRTEELCGHIGPKPLEIPQVGTEEEVMGRVVRAVHDGNAQVLMKGLINTSVYMRGTLNREQGFRTGRLLSMMAVYEAPGYHKLLFCSDSGINVASNLEQKKDILKNLLYAVRNMGIQSPKVVVLTANEMVDPKVVPTTDAAGLAETVKNEEGFLPCIIEDPIAFDVALDPKSAVHKKVGSRITGDMDLVILPNIEVGNIMGKSWTHLRCSPRGGIVLGASSPVTLGSRSNTVEIRLNSIALACLAVQSGK